MLTSTIGRTAILAALALAFAPISAGDANRHGHGFDIPGGHGFGAGTHEAYGPYSSGALYSGEPMHDWQRHIQHQGGVMFSLAPNICSYDGSDSYISDS